MKKWTLPAVAAVALVAAIGVTGFNGSRTSESQTAQATPETSEAGNTQTATAATANIVEVTEAEDGDYFLASADLTQDTIAFIRPMEDSKIELLARIGDDGAVKLALGTCQSCNGAPGAFYTQEGDILRCNNCGLTFDINVVDNPGGGCHPIMPDASVYTVTEDGMVLHTEALTAYEKLFTQVAAH